MKKEEDKLDRCDANKDNVNLDATNNLDISFIDIKNEKKKKKQAQRVSRNYDLNNMVDKSWKFFAIFLLIVLIAGSVFLVYMFFTTKDSEEKEEKVKIVKEIKNDDNYLFVGDSITYLYDLEKYYKDMPVVNSGVNGIKTQYVLEHLAELVYKYNPSKVFLLIGTNDFLDDSNNIVSNISNIIDGIKKNRPYCEIYLESIYPVNSMDKYKKVVTDKRDNKTISECNIKLKELAMNKKITFIDVYSVLVDEEGNLKEEYTSDGLHMSDKGNEMVTNTLIKFIENK